MKYIFLSILIIFLFMPVFVQADAPPEKGSLGDVSWYVTKQGERIFYYTRGAVVWGHQFGLIKGPDNCVNDLVWLEFSSRDEKVKDFVGKDVVVSLDIDGKIVKIGLNMIFAGTIGFTHVMYFSNWLAGQELINMLRTSREVKVQIIEPKELEVLLDIKEDTFDLGGFIDSRKQAEQMCNECFPQKEQEIEERGELMMGKSTGFIYF